MKIIAFGHRRRVGKDTAAKFLINYLKMEYSFNIKKVSLAYKLKLDTFQLYAWAGVKEPEYYENQGGNKEQFLPDLGMTVRELWIDYAMKVREVYNFTWVDYVLKSFNTDVLIVPDLRFYEEVERFSEHNATLIKIVKDDVEQHSDIADSALKDFDGWDYIVENNASLDTLYENMHYIADEIFAKA